MTPRTLPYQWPPSSTSPGGKDDAGGKLSHISGLNVSSVRCQTTPCPEPAVISLSLCSSAFENKVLGSGWFGGERKSPLQLLRELDQVSGWNALLHLDRRPQSHEHLLS